ncbi:MAG: peptide chain release factor N(5)-glutamine methyltransferase [Alphaproteobacteria bacterium]|nr:peptide chain release factor N(5)-glutamine methyltransferase [Alphaproteobacteria bacterium]
MEINQAFTILKSAGGIRAARIICDNTKKLTRFKVWRMAHALRRGVPVAKIINQKWFYGLQFYTNKYTLDPRPDTETLVAAVIADCGVGAKPRILDLGTGTGCIIGAIAKNVAGASGVAIDKSLRATRVAKKNMHDLGLGDRVRVLHCSFNRPYDFGSPFDIIVSNPPYIARGDMRVDAGARHDPKTALYAKNNGLAAYQIIAKNAKDWIKRGGKLYLEIGVGQDAEIKNIFESEKWTFSRAERDLGGIVRVLVFTI